MQFGKLSKEFIFGVVNGKFGSDEAAARTLYNSISSDRRFITLKHRAFLAMIDLLLLTRIKPALKKDYASVAHDCDISLMSIRVLTMLGKRDVALTFTRLLIVKAKKLHLNDIVIECLLLLRQSAAIAGNHEEYRAANEEINNVLLKHESELFTNGLVQLHQLHDQQERTTDEGIAIEATHYWIKADILRRMYPSRVLDLNYFRLRFLAELGCASYRKAIRICEEQERYLTSNTEVNSNAQFAQIALMQLYCRLQLGHYARGRKQALLALSILRPGEVNWFSCLELYFILEMRSANFTSAVNIFKDAARSFARHTLPDRLVDHWRICELYLRLYYYCGQASNVPSKPSFFDGNFHDRQFRSFHPLSLPANTPRAHANEMRMACYLIKALFTVIARSRTNATLLEVKSICSAAGQIANAGDRAAQFLQRLEHFYLGGTPPQRTMLPQSEIASGSPAIVNNPGRLEVIPYERIWRQLCVKYSRSH